MNPVVTTKKGCVRGLEKEGYCVFRNIPYAKPPVGELRWKRPVEMDPWEGVKDCTEFGNITVQTMPGEDKPWERLYYKEFYSDPAYLREMSEDCLNLNVWTPARTGEEQLPVAFWIHGGGFGGGYSSEIEFDGEAYCMKGVILVTIEYRCGVFGFLAHPWLSAEDPAHISGNYGIFDQIAALAWVRENIAAFGGDPDNITLFGQSAGSMSTQVLVSSPLTEGKFAKAILQSGVQAEGNFLATPTLREEEAFGERIVKLSGAGSLEELRELPAEILHAAKLQFDGEMFLKMQESGDYEAGGLMVVPCVDGYLLKQTVGETFRQGTMRPVPYMAGCTADDLGTTEEDRRTGSPGRILEEVKRWCGKQEELGNLPAYAYAFMRDMPDEKGEYVPAFHSAELWYTFGTLDRCWRPMEDRDRTLSREMVEAWTSFMKTGNPNGDGEEVWRPYTASDPFVRRFE